MVDSDEHAVEASSSSSTTIEAVNNYPDHKLLSKLSAGQITDLCYVQQQQQGNNNSSSDAAAVYVPYTPIDLQLVLAQTTMATTQQQHRRPVQEAGRLYTRLHALDKQLKRLSSLP